MKIRANRKELADALAWVAGALDKRTGVPALAGIRLSAADDVLTASAFDYETAHTARLDVDVADDGECLIPGAFLREVVGSLKGVEVELVLDGARLTISSGRSTYRAQTLAIEDYPHLPVFPTAVGSLAAEHLAYALGVVEHAVSRLEAHGILMAIHLSGGDGTLTADATDSYRIARATAPIEQETLHFDATIPAPALLTAAKGMRGAVTIGSDGGLFGLTDDRGTVTTRTLADEYPNLDRFLSMPPTGRTEVDAGTLAAAVKRACMAADRDRPMVHLTIGTEEIAVTADSEGSEGVEFVECQSEGQATYLFNGAYLAEALLATGSERVALCATGPGVKPVFVKPLDTERATLIVMPRRQL